MPVTLSSLTHAADALTELATPDVVDPDHGWTGREHRLWHSTTRAARRITDDHAPAGAALIAAADSWPPPAGPNVRNTSRIAGYSALPFLVPLSITNGARYTYWAPLPDQLTTTDRPRRGLEAVSAMTLALLADAVRANLTLATGLSRYSRRERASIRTEAQTYATLRDRAAPLALELTADLVDLLEQTGTGRGVTVQPIPVRLR